MKEIISKYLKEHGFGEFSPKAVLFDMDGVLYNSLPNHAVAWQESMKQFDIHMTAADAYATEGARGIEWKMSVFTSYIFCASSREMSIPFCFFTISWMVSMPRAPSVA